MSSPRIALVWSFAERYVNLVLNLGAAMIVARLLTPGEVGKFSLCAAALAITATLRDFGVSEYLVQEKQLTPAKLRGAFAVAIATAWPLGLLVFLGRHLIADYYAEPELAELIAILALNFAILPFATPAFAMISREMAFRQVFCIQLGSTLAQVVTSVTLALLGHGAHSLAWAAVAGVVVQSAGVALVRPRSTFILPDFRAAPAVLRYGTLSVTGRVIDTAAGTAHEFIIARMFGFTEVGLFSRAMGLIDMFTKNVTAAIARVATPVLAQAHRGDQNLTWSFARGTAVFTSVAWPAFGFMALVAPEIVRLMFGPQWDAAAHPATVMCLTMFPSSLYALSAPTLAAMGQVERRLRISLQFAPVHVTALLLVATLGGFQAMAWAWMITHLTLLWLHGRQLRSALRAGWGDLFGQCRSSVLVVICTAGLQWAAVAGLRAQGVHPLPLLLAAGAVGVGAWYVCVRALGHPVHDEVQRALSALQAARARRRGAT